MNYTFLDNGIDSFKAAFEKIGALQERPYKSHDVKDAIIYMAHGMEILFKYLVSVRNYEDIFSNKTAYRLAEKKRIELGKDNVFQVKLERPLKTISLKDAFMLLTWGKYSLNHPETLLVVVEDLINRRNEIMHASIVLTDEETAQLVEHLKFTYEELALFFIEHIENFEELTKNFRFDKEAFEEELYFNWLQDMQADAAMEAYKEGYYDQLADEQEALEEFHKH